MKRTLYIFGGLPGSGKTLLAKRLAGCIDATYIRADTIEQAMRQGGITLKGPEGYLVGYALATENLKLGNPVVADCVNPVEVTRQAWRDAAAKASAESVEIEIVCSDTEKHRGRVEARKDDIQGLLGPTFDEVLGRQYDIWSTASIRFDTANLSTDESSSMFLAVLREKHLL